MLTWKDAWLIIIIIKLSVVWCNIIRQAYFQTCVINLSYQACTYRECRCGGFGKTHLVVQVLTVTRSVSSRRMETVSVYQRTFQYKNPVLAHILVQESCISIHFSTRILYQHTFQYKNPLLAHILVQESCISIHFSTRILCQHTFQYKNPVLAHILVQESCISAHFSTRILYLHTFQYKNPVLAHILVRSDKNSINSLTERIILDFTSTDS